LSRSSSSRHIRHWLKQHPEPLNIDEEIQKKEIHEVIQYTTNNKAPGLDQISNRILKVIEKWLILYLLKIFNAFIRNSYYPKT